MSSLSYSSVLFVFVMVNQHAENKQLEAELKEAQELADWIKEREALKNNLPIAREGFKMVPHEGHWHEVPIDAPDTWEGEPHQPVVQQEELPPLTPQDGEKLWVSENGYTLSTFTAEGWAIPEGTLPSEIDLEGANALRKKLFTGLTIEELHGFNPPNLSPAERKLYSQAWMAEHYHRKPDKWIELREAHERLRDAKLANPDIFGAQ